MPKPKCAYCLKNAAKRFCPALDQAICPQCCGANRMKAIDCDAECRFLDNESYQGKVREQKELNELLHTVPSGQFDDILREEDAAMIAYSFETLIADLYVKGLFGLNDQKVKDTLTRLYFATRTVVVCDLDDFEKLLLEVYNTNLCEGYDDEYIRKIMLRLIISIKRMTGGSMGPLSYLNYLKNNIHPDYADFDGDTIMETKRGKRIPIPGTGKRSQN